MVEILKDRFTRGLLAGVLAGLLTLLWNVVSRFVLHIATLNYWDFASGFIFHESIKNLWEGVFAFILVKAVFGFGGIVFGFLIKSINSKMIILKGWVFGTGLWFVVYSLVIMFRIPNLVQVPSQTAISNFIGASIYGLFLGYFYDLLKRKSEQVVTETGKTRRFLFAPVPAKKQEQKEKKVRVVKPRKL